MSEDRSTFNSLTGTLMIVDALLTGENPNVEQAREIIEKELKRYGISIEQNSGGSNE